MYKQEWLTSHAKTTAHNCLVWIVLSVLCIVHRILVQFQYPNHRWCKLGVFHLTSRRAFDQYLWENRLNSCIILYVRVRLAPRFENHQTIRNIVLLPVYSPPPLLGGGRLINDHWVDRVRTCVCLRKDIQFRPLASSMEWTKIIASVSTSVLLPSIWITVRQLPGTHWRQYFCYKK